MLPLTGLHAIIFISYLDVDTTTDVVNWSDGVCSLREAILNVNNHNQGGVAAGECEIANGAIGSTITFSPAAFGSGGTITLSSIIGELPSISANYTTIDGWSAGGAGYKGPPLVTLDGSGLAASVSQIDGLYIPGSNCVVRGLAVINFETPGNGGSTGIDVYGTDNWVYGNYIGLQANGTTAAPNGYGLRLGSYSDGSLVGTNGDSIDDAAERNVVSGNLGTGIQASHGRVAGNYIGTDASGLLDRGNDVGVRAYNDAVVGGETSTRGNVISGNGDGIIIGDSASQYVIIRGNLIGVDKTGVAALGNDDDGIKVYSGSTDSGRLTIRGNVIASNGGDGIEILSCQSSTCPNYTGGHLILGNTIGLGSDGTTVLGNDRGIFLRHSPDNIVRDNILSGNVNTGLSLFDGGTTGNRVEFNLIGLNASDGLTYAQNVGVNVNGAPGNLIRGNTLAGSVTQLIVDSAFSPGDGNDNEISDNRIGTNRSGGYVTGFDYGLVVQDAQSTIVARNDIRYCHRAILLEKTASAQVAGNLLTLNASGGDTGIYLSDTATAVAGSTSNCIENNDVGADNTTGVNVVLENNWWGSATGPSGAGAGTGDSASANIDFNPWLSTRPACGISLLFLDDFEAADFTAWSFAATP